MDALHMFLVVLLGVIFYSHDGISGSVLDVTVRPGDNITLHCDCKKSSGVYIVWYKNCSHENQPSRVLKQKPNSRWDTTESRFQFVNNSDSYDLLIRNITDSDEGLYYCGTEEMKVKEEKYITSTYIYRYGNFTTRIIFKVNEDSSEPCDCVCWKLLFSLCPAFAVLSSLLSSLVVYHLCHKKAKDSQIDQQKSETRGQTRLNQDEDVCYAALEIRQASQRPRKKKAQSSDFSTYSAISTSRI